MIERTVLQQAKRIIIKVGSALITDGKTGVNTALIDYLAKTSVDLLKTGKEVAIVSSGAIAEGMSIMKYHKRPKQLSELQALAALGQMSLVHEYESRFENLGYHSAQILLTHDDQKSYRRYGNASRTLENLLKMKVIPIINENDVVADDEIRFGDNDRLAALACNLIFADVLIIMTDQEGLFTANPRKNTNAKLIRNDAAMKDTLLEIATTEGGELGSGGMHTKILAARQAAISGTNTVIVDGKRKHIIEDVLMGKTVGSFLYSKKPLHKLDIAEIFDALNS